MGAGGCFFGFLLMRAIREKLGSKYDSDWPHALIGILGPLPREGGKFLYNQKTSGPQFKLNH